MVVILSILLLVALIVFWVVSIYNRLVRMSNLKNEAWSGIDVQLKRRFDLIPNLVETVKGYATHEKEVFERVTEARAAITRAHTVSERAESENMLTGALKTLFAVAENYPALQASSDFHQLQEQLTSLEAIYKWLTGIITGLQGIITLPFETFPAVLVAKRFGYEKADYFETAEEERTTPKVSF